MSTLILYLSLHHHLLSIDDVEALGGLLHTDTVDGVDACGSLGLLAGNLLDGRCSVEFLHQLLHFLIGESLAIYTCQSHITTP